MIIPLNQESGTSKAKGNPHQLAFQHQLSLWKAVYLLIPIVYKPVWLYLFLFLAPRIISNTSRRSVSVFWLNEWGKAVEGSCVLWFSRFILNSVFSCIFPLNSVGKESACSAGNLGLILGLGRSPGEGNGNPLQYSCLEKSMDRGTWWTTVHGVVRVQQDLATTPPPPLQSSVDAVWPAEGVQDPPQD